MSASPADFELYSRATGYPVPADPAERMRMAPAVHAFSQNYAKSPQTQRTPGVVSRAAGGLGKAALGALAIGGIAALAGNQRGEIPPDDGGGGGGGPTEPPTMVGQKGFVRIPNRKPPREEPPKVKQVRKVEIPPKKSDSQAKVRSVRTPQYTKEQYGNVVTEKPRDLANEGENLAISILGGNNEGNISPYDQDDGGNIEIGSKYQPLSGWDRHRGAVERAADNVTLEKHWARSAVPLGGAVVGKNIYDFVNIASGGEAMGGPIADAVTESVNRVGLAVADKDPLFRAAHGAVDAATMTGQQALDTIGSWGFGPGHTVGDVLQFVGRQGANLPAAEGLGNVLEGLQHVAHTMPIELALGVGGAATGAAIIGGARGARKAGEVVDNVVGRAKSDLERVKRVMNSVKVDHSQVDETGADERRLAPNTLIHQGEDPQGGPAGLDALIKEVRGQLNKEPIVTTREEAKKIPYQGFVRGEGMGQSTSIAGLGIGDEPDTEGLLQAEFHKTPGKVYTFYDEKKRHPLVKEDSNILGGVMKGRRRNAGSGPMTGTVQIPSSLADQYYEEMDERLTQEARETDSAAFIEDKLRKKQVGVDEEFTAGGLVNALKKGGREGFQNYISRAAEIERINEDGMRAAEERGGKYPEGWWV